MAKGPKKSNGGKKHVNVNKVVTKGLVTKKPQSVDARKEKSINDLQDVYALSWTSEEDESESEIDHLMANHDRNKIEVGNIQLSN